MTQPVLKFWGDIQRLDFIDFLPDLIYALPVVASLVIGTSIFICIRTTYRFDEVNKGKKYKTTIANPQSKKSSSLRDTISVEEYLESFKNMADRPLEKCATTDVVTLADTYRKRTFDEYFKAIIQRINSWKKEEVLDRCKSLRIHSKSVGELKGKLKQTYKQQARLIHKKMASGPPMNNSFSYFDYLVVIDFEATCIENGPSNFCHEIIQFPAVLVDVRRQIIVDKFCVYVKPSINPTLSEFCKKLTGITQEQVNNAPDFVEALSMFKNWLKSHQLGTVYKYAIVCDGQFDMGRFMYLQCEISKIPYFQEALYWVNIRKCFKSFYNVKWVSLRLVLDVLGQPFIGRPHNGLDDAITIASVLLRLLRDGCVILLNEKIVLKKSEQDRIAREPKTSLHQLDTVQPLTRSDFLNVYNNMNLQRQQARKFAEATEKAGINANKENLISGPVNFQPRKKAVSSKRYVKKHSNCNETPESAADEIPEVSFALLQEE